MSEYTAAANALVIAIHDIIVKGIPGTTFTGVPLMFQNMIPAALIPAVAGYLAKIAVDASNASKPPTG